MREDDCRSLLCLQQNFAKMLKPRVQAVVTASCLRLSSGGFGHPHLFLCLQSFSIKIIGSVGRVKKGKKNRLFSLFTLHNIYGMSHYFFKNCTVFFFIVNLLLCSVNTRFKHKTTGSHASMSADRMFSVVPLVN